MQNRYEIITDDSQTNFRFTAGWGKYATSHLHREFELGLVLKNDMTMTVKEEQFHLTQGDMWLINPFENHAPHAKSMDSPTEFVQVQLSPTFFKAYFPELRNLSFQAHCLTKDSIGHDNLLMLQKLLVCAALEFYQKNPYYQLQCASNINLIFHTLLTHTPHSTFDRVQAKANSMRTHRMQRITAIIEENYDTKLLLSDIARKENLSMQYLSHFFHENWGMSYQQYLTNFRCGKARQLLITTDMSISDVSLICGFSDPKYLRQGFRKLYGCDPSYFRKNRPSISTRQEQMHTQVADEYTYPPQEAIHVLKTALDRSQSPL
ncbi:MAG: helix-turn-helix transcriptional regulator [Clostridia bacterium]|nr:helix-turn-helix transcriptional regulator [Clostridia bacterium]